MTLKCALSAMIGMAWVPGAYFIVGWLLDRVRQTSKFVDPRLEPGVPLSLPARSSGFWPSS